MDEFEIFLDKIIDEQIVRLAYHATEIQTRIDSFIAVNLRSMTASQLESLMTFGSSAVLAEVDAMKNAITRSLVNATTESAQSGYMEETKKRNPDDRLYRWVIASGDPCPDCQGRALQGAYTMEYWESVGLPQSGSTICGSNCKCLLQPT